MHMTTHANTILVMLQDELDAMTAYALRAGMNKRLYRRMNRFQRIINHIKISDVMQ